MNINLKLTSAAEALARAHRAARHGSTDALSGRISEREEYVLALLARAQSAHRSLSNWEAINNLLVAGGDATRAVQHLELLEVGPIRLALARDSILAAFALSDPSSKDRVSICEISEWLRQPGAAEQMSGEDWAVKLAVSEVLAKTTAEANGVRIKRILSLVPSDWKDEPEDRSYKSLRTLLRPVRNQLAHALDVKVDAPPTVNAMREFVDLTLLLATDAAFLWLGSAISFERIRAFHKEQAEKFWFHAFANPIELWSRDMQSRRSAGIDSDK